MENNIDLSTLEAGDKVKLRCGGELTHQQYLDCNLNWTTQGYYCYWRPDVKEPDPFDIIEIIKAPKPKVIEGWVNIYEGDLRYMGYVFSDKRLADDDDDRVLHKTRIACKQVSISYVEGEGL